jgi:hypothetical protein
MGGVPDFTENDRWIIQSTVSERYRKEVPLQSADVEVRLHSNARELTVCPAIVWRERDANFVVIKTGDNRFRAQFYYRGWQMYGTGREEYDDLAECVVSLLQVQADHEAREQGISSSRK